MNLTTTKSNEFRQWIKENFKIDPNELKPPEIHDKFIVYLAWRQSEHKQPPQQQEKLQQSRLDTN
jgi:methyl coenzyme M reductase alpha subunit